MPQRRAERDVLENELQSWRRALVECIGASTVGKGPLLKPAIDGPCYEVRFVNRVFDEDGIPLPYGCKLRLRARLRIAQDVVDLESYWLVLLRPDGGAYTDKDGEVFRYELHPGAGTTSRAHLHVVQPAPFHGQKVHYPTGVLAPTQLLRFVHEEIYPRLDQIGA